MKEINKFFYKVLFFTLLTFSVSAEDKILKIYPTGHVGMIASSLSQKKVLPEMGKWLAERS